ncbi:MAG: MATE family efflux transporter, partial [Patescibacteria group bacterium]
MKFQKNKYTSGPIIKSLISLAVPIVGANILQTLYQLTDTFWVGRLGASAIAAVSISFPIIFFLIALGGGFSIAGSILVAQYKGKEDKETVNRVAGQTILMVLLVSLLITTLGYFISPFVVRLMGVESDVFLPAVQYLQISFIGLISFFGFFVIQAILRGIGEVKKPFYIVLATVLLNLLLDPLFIFGYGIIPAFGVAGAAIATIGTQTIATLFGLNMLLSGKYGINLKLSYLKPDKKIIVKMFKLGLPASVEQSLRALGIALMTILATFFGTNSIAAFGIGTRILSFIIIPGFGLADATTTLVGQNIGAKKIYRAEKTIKFSLIISFTLLTVIGIIIFIFADQLAGFFILKDLEVIKSASLFIKIMALTFGFVGAQLVINGALLGAGETM